MTRLVEAEEVTEEEQAAAVCPHCDAEFDEADACVDPVQGRKTGQRAVLWRFHCPICGGRLTRDELGDRARNAYPWTACKHCPHQDLQANFARRSPG